MVTPLRAQACMLIVNESRPRTGTKRALIKIHSAAALSLSYDSPAAIMSASGGWRSARR